MKKSSRAFGLALLGALMLAGAASAQISENGPYYAQPSWDQQLPASSRFVILTNWGSAAVLDRETGLVWQQNPSTNAVVPWANAVDNCPTYTTGDRYGWRLPSVEELATLLDPSTSMLVSGAPFTLPSAPYFWTATTYAENTTAAYIVSFVRNIFVPNVEPLFKTASISFWCVRGYRGTQSPQ